MDVKDKFKYSVTANIVKQERYKMNNNFLYIVIYRRLGNESIRLEIYGKRVSNKNKIYERVFCNMKQARRYLTRYFKT